MSDNEGLQFDPSELIFLQSQSEAVHEDEESVSLCDEEVAFLHKEPIDQRADRMNAIIDDVQRSIPPVPTEMVPKVLHWLYYSCMCCLFYTIKGEDFDWTPQLSDSDEMIREKAFGLYFDRMLRIFMNFADELDENFYNMILDRIYAHLGNHTKHPIITYMERISTHKELHSRGVKADPCLPRTRNDGIQQSVLNIITQETYASQIAPENSDTQAWDTDNPTPWHLTEEQIEELRKGDQTGHKSNWKMLIINPLPSDTDENAVDPVDRTQEEELIHAVDVVHKEKRDLQPYGVFVTDDWNKLLRTLHGTCHLLLYVQDRMYEAITEEQRKEMHGMAWEVAWKKLAGKHANKHISELSGNKKGLPAVIVNLMELRDFVQFVVSFN